MPFVLFIRHGENDFSKKGILAGRRRGVHLNQRGHEQALELGKALADAPIRAIYSSPLDRAVETALPIARALRVSLRREPGLLESDVGDWEGRSVRRLAHTTVWRVFQQAPSRAVHPSGESIIATQSRVVAAVTAICAKHKPRDLIACVSHADPIKLVIAHYIGLPLDYFQRLACETASLSLLAITPTNAQLIWLNRRPPLDLQPLK